MNILVFDDLVTDYETTNVLVTKDDCATMLSSFETLTILEIRASSSFSRLRLI